MLGCRKGEEVTHTYNWDNERNDYSLINYFFIQKPQQPRLCAVDLPKGHLDGGFGEHDDHYLPHEKNAIMVQPSTLYSYSILYSLCIMHPLTCTTYTSCF